MDFNSLVNFVLIPFITAAIVYIFSKINKYLGYVFALLGSALLFYPLYLFYNKTIDSYIWAQVFSQNLIYRINPLSWLFALIIVSIFFLVFIFAFYEMKDKDNSLYFSQLLVVEGGLLGVALSGDLITFFLFWEVMSWNTFFLIWAKNKESFNSALKYLNVSLIGANSMLVAIILIYLKVSSFNFYVIADNISSFSPVMLYSILALFLVGLFVEAAVMPLHIWVPSAYKDAPTSTTVVLAGVMEKIGVFGIFLVLYLLIGLNTLNKVSVKIFSTPLSLYIIGWIAAITIVAATFMAIIQEDAKKLLAYSSISQVGYIVLALSTASSLGIAAGFLHLINHTIFKSLLFFSVGAVIYRTGTTKLYELGGLIKKMPVAFIGVLMGIIAVAGTPPLNGFVSKWLIFQSLLAKKEVFLLIMAFIGSAGAFMYLYRLIHSIFLGQLPEEFKDIKEVPFFMQIPIWILSILTIVLGLYPGFAMKLIAPIEEFIHIVPISYTMTGFPDFATLGSLNALNVALIFFILFIIAYVFFYISIKQDKLSQYDNYAAGQKLTPEIPYTYNYNFYQSFKRVIAPCMNLSIDKIYNKYFTEFSNFSNSCRRLYSGNLEDYISYIVSLSAIFALLYLIGGKLW